MTETNNNSSKLIEELVQQQSEIAKKFMQDGQFPIVTNGKHLTKLLREFYGPWQLIEIRMQHHLMYGPISKEVITSQLKDIEVFVTKAESVSYQDAMDT